MAQQNIPKTPPEQKDLDAQYAHALEGNPLFNRCLDELEEAYTKQIVNSEETETELRERCFYMIRSVQELRKTVRTYINTGNLDKRRVRNTATGQKG